MFNRFNTRSTDYKTVFETESGKQVLYDLAKMTGAYSQSYVTGDSLETARNEGKREVYNYIIRLLEGQHDALHRQFYQDVAQEQMQTILEQEKEIYG